MFTAIAFLAASSALARPEFDEHFTGRTLRFDYHHAGTAGEEHVGSRRLAPGGRVAREPHAARSTSRTSASTCSWSIDPRTNRALYSRGFASIYGEWETTGEAKHALAQRSTSRCASPSRARPSSSCSRSAPTTAPSARSTRRPSTRRPLRRPLRGRARAARSSRSSRTARRPRKVDLLVLADGYTAAEHAKFRDDVERLTGVLFATEPFARRAGRLQRARACSCRRPSRASPTRAAASGATTPLGARFNAFDSDRYVLTYANRELREVAAQAPYDALILVFNERKYGGGGIFNLWSTCAADSRRGRRTSSCTSSATPSPASADEYYTSQVAYEEFNPAGVEPWEPNVTALLDPARLKWRDLVGRGTPLPTPWEQGGLRRDRPGLPGAAQRAASRAEAPEEEFEALFREVRAATRAPARGRDALRRRSAPSRAPATRPRASTAPRSTASCSRATRRASAASASMRSEGRSTAWCAEWGSGRRRRPADGATARSCTSSRR